MALWKQALAKLRGAADTVRPPESDTDSGAAVEPQAQPAAVGGETTAGPEGANESRDARPASAASEALARELRTGIQVSIGDLEPCTAGWRYRGHPVMVFGTEAPELADAGRRRDFFSLVHLFPCCGALESEERSVWVATDLAALNKAQPQGPFEFCRACLDAAVGRGADTSRFEFVTHVRSHAGSYFAESACYWEPGANPLPLQPPADEAEGSCPNCGCASEEPGWQLCAADTQQLALPGGTCLLCAERQLDGCLHPGGAELLGAAQVRYRFLLSQAAQAPEPSWKLAEAILPLAWQPLLRGLQRMLPPPELFYAFSDSAAPAVLAWPALGRGVVEEALAPEDAEGWSLWSREQIESELGFKSR